jgi:hypothetical protein
LDDPLRDVSHDFLFDSCLWLADSCSCFAMKIGSSGAIKQRRKGASGVSLGGLVGASIGLRYTLYFSTG